MKADERISDVIGALQEQQSTGTRDPLSHDCVSQIPVDNFIVARNFRSNDFSRLCDEEPVEIV